EGKVFKASTFTAKRKPTGEIAKLDKLIEERGPYSEISGKELVPKGHPKYHYQVFHILGIGMYPDLRLEDDNILLTTWQEQVEWTERKWTLRNKPEWAHVFEREAAMKRMARRVS